MLGRFGHPAMSLPNPRLVSIAARFKASSHLKINRRPTPEEVEEARQYALKKGLNIIS